MYLSKSQYLRGLQCHKALWLYRHKHELMAPIDANREALFATGHEVGELAKARFPGGVEIEFERANFDTMAARTAESIEAGATVIYEATFISDGLLAMADILLRNGDCWDFFEVKSSTRVKPYHLNDAAIQWHILGRHIALGRAHIMHIDNRYRLEGELDLQQLLRSVDVTSTVLSMQKDLHAGLASMRAMLDAAEPDVAIGTQCSNPFECDFKHYCWQSVPKPSVLDLYKLRGERKFELYHQGRVHYRDLRSLPLSTAQKLQVNTALSGQPHIEPQRLGDFIGSASYPIHFLDFETLQDAVPRFQGQRPYQQIPFQYSLHILHGDGQLEQRECLAGEREDPRPVLAAQLAQDLGANGSIVAYSQSTEIAAINVLAKHCGDFSIKSVLPAMFAHDEELNYSGLAVADGRTAMTVYASLARLDDEVERRRIRAALRAYCRLDTLAMVRIWQALAELARVDTVPN